MKQDVLAPKGPSLVANTENQQVVIDLISGNRCILYYAHLIIWASCVIEQVYRVIYSIPGHGNESHSITFM